MNAEQETAVREAFTEAMSQLTPEQLRELIFEPYESLRKEVQ